MRIITVAVPAVLLFAAGGAAQTPGSGLITPGELEWHEIAPGLEFAAVQGDWSAGPHKKYVRIAAGAVFPVHTHSAAAHVVVVSGDFTHTYSADEERQPLAGGAYVFIPAGQPHANSCESEEPCVIFTVYEGAFDLDIPEGD